MPVRAHHVQLKLKNDSFGTYDRGSVFRDQAESKSLSKQQNLFPEIARKRPTLTPMLDRKVSTPKRIYFKGDPNSRNYKDSTPSVAMSYGVSPNSAHHINEKERFKLSTKNYGTEEKEMPSNLEVCHVLLMRPFFSQIYRRSKKRNMCGH